ncbi:MAG: hypothetical protein WC091_14995 [Sulfuricellaceae bacterium]
MTDPIHSDPELTKTRRISFAGLTPAEVHNVADILNKVEHVEAVLGADGSSVVVTYCIAEHKLEELENVLSAQGYKLESNLLERIRLGLIHFTEEIQQENLHTPLRSYEECLRTVQSSAPTMHLNESAPKPPEEKEIPPEEKELRNCF